MTSTDWGYLAAAPAAIILSGVIMLPLFWRREHGKHTRYYKVRYRCECTVRSVCERHAR